MKPSATAPESAADRAAGRLAESEYVRPGDASGRSRMVPAGPRVALALGAPAPEELAGVRHALRRAGFFGLGIAPGVDVRAWLQDVRPDALLYDLDDPDLGGWEGLDSVRQVWTGPVVVRAARASDADLDEAVRRGVVEYLLKPATPEELVAAIRLATETPVREPVAPPAASPAAPTPARGSRRSDEPAPPPEPESPPERRGVLITLFSTKGGVGKTTLAANLGVALFEKTRRVPVLVDLDLEFGCLAAFFGLRAAASIADLCRLDESLAGRVTEKALLAGQPPGLRILAAPPGPDLAAEVEGEGKAHPGRNYVEEILTGLLHRYDLVVVDAGCNFREAALTALDLSDLVLLVSTGDIPSLQNTGKCLDVLLKRLEYPAEKFRLVLNRGDRLLGLSDEDIRQGLAFPIYHKLPTDEPTAVWAANYGRPFMIDRPNSRLGRAVAELADRLAAEVEVRLLPRSAGRDAAGRPGGGRPAGRPGLGAFRAPGGAAPARERPGRKAEAGPDPLGGVPVPRVN